MFKNLTSAALRALIHDSSSRQALSLGALGSSGTSSPDCWTNNLIRTSMY